MVEWAFRCLDNLRVTTGGKTVGRKMGSASCLEACSGYLHGRPVIGMGRLGVTPALTAVTPLLS